MQQPTATTTAALIKAADTDAAQYKVMQQVHVKHCKWCVIRCCSYTDDQDGSLHHAAHNATAAAAAAACNKYASRHQWKAG
eukprot:13292-Heterococcus_DN1.PRE.3